MQKLVGSLALGALVVGLGSMAGCFAPAEPGNESVGVGDDSIIGGSYAGTAYDPVVAVLWVDDPYNPSYVLGACTGTNIAVSGYSGYVLTAAHCCDPSDPPNMLLSGSDYLTGGGYPYLITQTVPHPSYVFPADADPDQDFDFCIVTYDNGGLPPAVYPAMSPSQDVVTVGSVVRQVGYGQDVVGPSGSGSNSAKKYIDSTVIGYFTTYQVGYDESAGGTCFGDSGGPDLYDLGGGNYVVYGVHSWSYDECQYQSSSGIVSTIYTWIQGELGGAVSCDDCVLASQTGTCATQTNTCVANQQCLDLNDCLYNCGSDATCQDSCLTAYPSGVSDLDALYICFCDTACVSECAAECVPSSSTSASSTSAATTTSTSTWVSSVAVTTGTGPTAVSAVATTSSSGSAAGGGGFTAASGSGSSVGGASGSGGGAGGNQTRDDDASESGGDDGGCSCEAAGAPAAPSGAGFSLALGLAFAATRRRRPAPRCRD